MDRFQDVTLLRDRPLEIGDVVLMWDYTLEKQWSRKFDDRWYGPFVVVGLGDANTAWLAELDGTRMHAAVSTARLKLFRRRSNSLESFAKSFSCCGDIPSALLQSSQQGGLCEQIFDQGLAQEIRVDGQSRSNWFGCIGIGMRGECE